MNTENPSSATTASEVATLKTGLTVTMEKGSIPSGLTIGAAALVDGFTVATSLVY